MILFSNLKEIKVNTNSYSGNAVLQLTSSKLKSSISTNSSKSEIETFADTNKLTAKHQQLIDDLFSEAKKNKFTVIIKNT